MPTISSKLKGTFHLGDALTGVDCEAQISHIGTPQTVTRDAAVTVLTGDVVQAGASYSWALTGTALLDWTDAAGMFYWVHTNQGTNQAFTFAPIGDEGPEFAGMCVIDGWNLEELAAGSIVSSKFAFPIQGQLTITPPAGQAVRADVADVVEAA